MLFFEASQFLQSDRSAGIDTLNSSIDLRGLSDNFETLLLLEHLTVLIMNSPSPSWKSCQT